MNRSLCTLGASVVFMCVCGSLAPGALIYDFFPDTVTGAARSNTNGVWFGLPPAEAADDFTLTAPGTVASLHFTGAYLFGNHLPLNGDDNFLIQLYADASGQPMDAPSFVLDINATERFDTGTTSGSYEIFDYQIDVGPVNLDAGTWWISIINRGANDDSWHIGTNEGGAGYSTRQIDTSATPNGAWQLGFPTDFLLQIDDQAQIPAPTSGAVLLLGIGACTRRRR